MPVEDPRAKLVSDLLNRHQLSMRWLAVKINESHVNVSRWLNTAPPKDRGKYSAMLDAIKEYESGQLGESAPRIVARRMVVLPVLPDLPASPMNSSYADVESMAVPDLGTGEEVYLRRISGHSMSPLIEAGDVVMFACREPQPKQVVHAFDGGNETVKVFNPKRSNGGTLDPVNLDYDPIPLPGMTIKGVAVMIVRSIAGGKATFEYPGGIFYR
jgi:SOS-response transcriptional repressor LexA